MKIILGDCIEKMKDLPTQTVDAIVTDPPYGWRFMGKAWDGADIEKTILNKARKGELFDEDSKRIGKAQSAGLYDNSQPANQSFQVWSEYWAREAFRILKPGGHMLVFCGPRTYHRMASGVEDAGFEIRDQLQWLFGSGFPKSHNIGDGWGTALKPANEPIVLARKPLEKGLTVAQNVEKWGVGALNIDAGRIGTTDTLSIGAGKSLTFKQASLGTNPGAQHSAGRWPANVLFDEEAAAILDEQSGVTTRNDLRDECKTKGFSGSDVCFGDSVEAFKSAPRVKDYGGGASRFFYVAKTSKRERNAGLEGMPEKVMEIGDERPSGSSWERRDKRQASARANTHPTVKPIKLMEYLCKLITPPGGIILDPFLGSGSTGCAAVKLGFQFIGIEREAEYVEIAKRRIEYWQSQGPDVDDPDDKAQTSFDLEGA